MKSNLFKIILAVSLAMIVGSAAKASRATIPENLEIPGYDKTHYFNLVEKTLDGVSFVGSEASHFSHGGDISFRTDYGLYNYGSGNRDITVLTAVKAGDIVIIEFGSTSTSHGPYAIVKGFESVTLPAVSYASFKATADAESFIITLGRSNYLSAIYMAEEGGGRSTKPY